MPNYQFNHIEDLYEDITDLDETMTFESLIIPCYKDVKTVYDEQQCELEQRRSLNFD